MQITIFGHLPDVTSEMSMKTFLFGSQKPDLVICRTMEARICLKIAKKGGGGAPVLF